MDGSGIGPADTKGLGMASLVTTFVAETNEFIITFGSVSVSFPVTVLHTSANACN